MPILEDEAAITEVLATYRTVAVLGASLREYRAGHYVPRYLNAHGYQIFPVNPTYASEILFGTEVVSTLADLEAPVEVIDVFRRRDYLEGHLPEILALSVLPKVVWFQPGVYHDTVAQKLAAAGIDVVQNRCRLADHQRWF